ncbi:unnamed protein product [Urochloa humidicola]
MAGVKAFEAYFRRADLNKDGQEAIAFFQGAGHGGAGGLQRTHHALPVRRRPPLTPSGATTAWAAPSLRRCCRRAPSWGHAMRCCRVGRLRPPR